MKKITLASVLLFIILSALFLLFSCSNEGKDFTYTSSDGNITITGYIGDSAEVVIPDQILTEKVVAIAEGAFKDNDTISSMTIPDSVTAIGDEAFYRCTNLVSLNMGNGVTNIGNKAFFGCSKLESVDLSSEILYSLLANDTFANCYALKNMDLPEATLTDQNAESSYLSMYGLKIWPDSCVTFSSQSYPVCEYSFDYFYYYYSLIKENLDEGDSSVWEDIDETYYSNLRSYVFEYIKRDYCLEILISKLSEAEKASLIEQYRQSILETINPEESTDSTEFIKEYEENNPEEYRAGLCQYYLTKLYAQLFDAENRSEWIEESIDTYSKDSYSAEHVLISFEKHSAEEALSIANQVCALSKSVKDFPSIIKQYNEDEDMPDDGKGLTMSAKTLEADYLTALSALEIGKTSEVVKGTEGYYVIHRLKLDGSEFYAQVFSDYLNTIYADTAAAYNSFTYNVTPLNLF